MDREDEDDGAKCEEEAEWAEDGRCLDLPVVDDSEIAAFPFCTIERTQSPAT